MARIFDRRKQQRNQSSASGHLRGVNYRGRTISSVEKAGKSRIIIFSDGTKLKTTKKVIAALSRIKGTINQKLKYYSSSEKKKKLIESRSIKRQQSLKENYLKRLKSEKNRNIFNKFLDYIRGREITMSGHKIKNLNTAIQRLEKSYPGNIYRGEGTIYKNLPWSGHTKSTSRKIKFPKFITIRKRGGKKLRVPVGNVYTK